MKKNQRGLGAVELLIIIAVVALASFSAWYVGRHSSSKTTVATDTNSSVSTLQQAVNVTKTYYTTRYINNSETTDSGTTLQKLLTPKMIETIRISQGHGDLCSTGGGGGFTNPDKISVKGISSGGKSAEVELAFSWNANPVNSVFNIMLVYESGSWLIDSTSC